MKQINDYGEKIRIVAYFTRSNKGCVTGDRIKKVWCQWWKSDFDCSDTESDELINDICKRVVDIQIPTRKMSRRQTLDYLKNILNDYRYEQYKIFSAKAKRLGIKIHNKTIKDRSVSLGRYKIFENDYFGTYDEVNNILSTMKVTKK